MSSYYHEFRPAFCGEASAAATITIEGSGSIAGQTFEGTLHDPAGTEVADAVTVAIASAADREITVTIDGQTTPGEYRWACRRTDDDTDAVVAYGVIEYTDPEA